MTAIQQRQHRRFHNFKGNISQQRPNIFFSGGCGDRSYIAVVWVMPTTLMLLVLLPLVSTFSPPLTLQQLPGRHDALAIQTTIAAQPFGIIERRRRRKPHLLMASSSKDKDDKANDDEEDDEDDDTMIDLSDQDWRTFRAKLVMSSSSQRKEGEEDMSTETTSNTTATTTTATAAGDLDGIGALFLDEMPSTSSSSSTSTTTLKLSPLDPSQWAYDSGMVIEQGAVILGGVEQDYGFGLRQQYFHKAAILVLDHDESVFTRGIILNRPTDLMFEDDINVGVKWRIWYGGDVQGISSDTPEIVCLHTLKDVTVTRASISVMKDIQWTSFDAAKRLVHSGVAQASDFWVFCGYAGWGPKQLLGELERKSWYMVATDSQTLLKELSRQTDMADPRDAGLETWSLLMEMIGRGSTAMDYAGGFDDLMLKEWARKNLLSIEAGGGAVSPKLSASSTTSNDDAAAGGGGGGVGGLASTQELEVLPPVDRLLKRVTAVSLGEDVTEGTLVRASSTERSPFLLENQDLHKAVVLVISDDEKLTVGVILNRPGSRGLEIHLQEKGGAGKAAQVKVPLRYGGQFTVKGSQPLLWLHCHPVLKAAKIGSAFGSHMDGIWKCTSNDMVSAVSQGLATPADFMVVAGVSVWTKGAKGQARGMQGEIRVGRFEIVPSTQIQSVWDELAKQETLSETNLVKNLIIANDAWTKGGVSTKDAKESNASPPTAKTAAAPPIGGLGDGFDEEDDSLVFKSDVRVSKLSDDALRSWVATFMLGAPSLGE